MKYIVRSKVTYPNRHCSPCCFSKWPPRVTRPIGTSCGKVLTVLHPSSGGNHLSTSWSNAHAQLRNCIDIYDWERGIREGPFYFKRRNSIHPFDSLFVRCCLPPLLLRFWFPSALFDHLTIIGDYYSLGWKRYSITLLKSGASSNGGAPLN